MSTGCFVPHSVSNVRSVHYFTMYMPQIVHKFIVHCGWGERPREDSLSHPPLLVILSNVCHIQIWMGCHNLKKKSKSSLQGLCVGQACVWRRDTDLIFMFKAAKPYPAGANIYGGRAGSFWNVFENFFLLSKWTRHHKNSIKCYNESFCHKIEMSWNTVHLFLDALSNFHLDE